MDFYKYLADFNFPGLCKDAKRMICMFGSTYRCEQCFSKLKFIKNIFRTSLTDEHMLDYLRTPMEALERCHWWGTDRVQPIYGGAR